MKQIIQNYRSGKLKVTDVPVPTCSPNNLLVRNRASLISLGTERSIIELGKKSLLGKARARPDLVKRFMEKVKNEGLLKTYKEALDRLDTPTALGYSSAGRVIEVGNNVHKFSPGDRVACIGAGYASHAEYITVPEHLCCRIPDKLSFEKASFGMLGIIAMNGIRCAKITFGESVAVIGLGLLGLLSVQILKAYGCKVIGMDIDPKKTELAINLGVDSVYTSDESLRDGTERTTKGHGIDAVIITASAKTSGPVHIAVDIARYGGRIVLVGVADIHPHRNEMWQKEVEIIVSKGGGPGTLDPIYENKGIDYPIGYTRWTENRNLEEFIRLISEKKVKLDQLISHRFDIGQAETVYNDMLKNKGGSHVGVILQYADEPQITVEDTALNRTLIINKTTRLVKKTMASEISVGVIGAGLFGRSLMLPSLKQISNFRLDTIATSSSANSVHTANKYGFEKCTTDYLEVITNKEIDAVFILTPHSLHARMVVEALRAGKHVFVEKPLCVNEKELNEIIAAYNDSCKQKSLILLVGYNRRFSVHAAKTRKYLSNRQDPLVVNCRVNAGFVAADHWVHSEEEGGSRVIGEICHFVDTMQFFTGSDPIRVFTERISGNNTTSINSDNIVVTLKFIDGSLGNILYSASGDRSFSRERIEIFFQGSSILIDDFRRTEYYRSGKKNTLKTANQQLGYKEELQHFANIINGKEKPLLTAEECFKSTSTVFLINKSMEKGLPVEIPV